MPVLRLMSASPAHTAVASTAELSHAVVPVAGAVRMAKANPSPRVRVCCHLVPERGIELEPPDADHAKARWVRWNSLPPHMPGWSSLTRNLTRTSPGSPRTGALLRSSSRTRSWLWHPWTLDEPEEFNMVVSDGEFWAVGHPV